MRASVAAVAPLLLLLAGCVNPGSPAAPSESGSATDTASQTSPADEASPTETATSTTSASPPLLKVRVHDVIPFVDVGWPPGRRCDGCSDVVLSVGNGGRDAVAKVEDFVAVTVTTGEELRPLDAWTGPGIVDRDWWVRLRFHAPASDLAEVVHDPDGNPSSRLAVAVAPDPAAACDGVEPTGSSPVVDFHAAMDNRDVDGDGEPDLTLGAYTVAANGQVPDAHGLLHLAVYKTPPGFPVSAEPRFELDQEVDGPTMTTPRGAPMLWWGELEESGSSLGYNVEATFLDCGQGRLFVDAFRYG